MDANNEYHIKLNQTQSSHVPPLISDLRLYVHI